MSNQSAQSTLIDGQCPQLTLDEALDMNLVGVFHYRLLFLCGLAFMADSLEVNLMTFLATCAGEEWNLTKQQQAAVSGIVFAGILIGSLFWGIFADRYGRKKTFLLACGIISFFGLCSGLAPNYIVLIIFRALVGFGIGGAHVPFDLLAEFIPDSHRGSFLVYIEYFWSIGSLFIAGLAWSCLSTFGWRFLTLMTTIPVILTSLLSILYLPESPRWLLLKGRKDEAERVVREAAAVNGFTMPPFSLATDLGDLNSHNNGSYLDFINTAEARRLSGPLFLVWFLLGLSYYSLILFVSKINISSSESGSDTCSFDFSAIFANTVIRISH